MKKSVFFSVAILVFVSASSIFAQAPKAMDQLALQSPRPAQAAPAIETAPVPSPEAVRPNVITIYFCGTGTTKEWWKAEEAHSPDGKSGFWAPELVSTLFYEQDDNSYKLIVNGIGTDDVPGFAASSPTSRNASAGTRGDKGLIGQAFPSSFLADRGWKECIAEAMDYINSVLATTEGEITLNLVGHSRGGVLTMLIADRIKNDTRINAINILALDPVPGDNSVPLVAYTLNGNVKNYVGIYSEDERTKMFSPVIPESGPETSVWLLTLPGSHETMIGNLQKDGHSVGDYYSDPELKQGNSHRRELRPVGRLTKTIATELLSSQAWGGVSFSRNPRYGPVEDSRLELIETAQNMRSEEAEELYEGHRTVAYIPTVIPGFTSLMAFYDGRAQVLTSSDVENGRQNEPRAVYKMEGGRLRSLPLNEVCPVEISAEQILDKLMEFGGLN